MSKKADGKKSSQGAESQSLPKNQKQPSQEEKSKPDREEELALVSSPSSVDPLILDFAKAHAGFERSFGEALGYAKDAGEFLLKLQVKTGLKGVALFAHVREQGEITVSDRSCYLYQRIASRWNELQVLAGDELSELKLAKATKLLQEPKEKPKDNPVSTNGQQATEIASNAALEKDATEVQQSGKNPTGQSAQEGQPSQGGSGNSQEGEQPSGGQPSGVTNVPADAKPTEAQEGEKAITVQPPFDQPEKDRLAAVYAENGPASTPIQLMTNLVIPSLKKVAEVGISDDDLPFFANAINEAQALIETLKQKYRIT